MTGPAMPPVPPDWGSWEDLYHSYQEQIQAESEWLREMGRQRGIWERRTLRMQHLLEPYWDWQAAERFPDEPVDSPPQADGLASPDLTSS